MSPVDSTPSGCSYSVDGISWTRLPAGPLFNISPGRDDRNVDLETDVGLRWVYAEVRRDRWELTFRFTEAERAEFLLFNAVVDSPLVPFYLRLDEAGAPVLAMFGRKDAGMLARGVSIPAATVVYEYRLVIMGEVADLEALGMSDLVELTNRVIVLEGQMNDVPGGVLDRLDHDPDEDELLIATMIAAALGSYVIPDGSVTAAKVAANAIETAKLVDGAVTELKIGALAVSNAKLAVNSISADKIQADAVTNSKLIDGAISAVKLATDSVTNAKIAVDAISSDKLQASSVTIAKVAAAVQAALGDTPDNILNNGGGEEGTTGSQATGWALGSGAGALVAEDFAQVGARSIKIISVAQDSYSSQSVALESGGYYELSGWIKTAAHSLQSSRYANLNLDQATPLTIIQKETIGTDPSSSQADCGLPLDGVTRDWTFVRCRFRANATETGTLYLQVGRSGTATATAWFDGVVLRKIHAIYTDDLIANSVTAGKIASHTITAAEIAALTITAAEISAGAIVAGKLATDSVVSANIQAAQITTVKIAAGAVTATEIAANTITAAKIAALTITAAEIAAGAIVAGKLATDSVVAANIAAGEVTAVKINVSDLSAISANLGSITAGSIDSVTITSSSIIGGLVATDSAGVGHPRVQMTLADGLVLVDAFDQIRVALEASSYAGLQVNGMRSIDTGDIFMESLDQSVQLFVSQGGQRISFGVNSVLRAYVDDQDGNGAGNQPTSWVLRCNNTMLRVNRAAAGGFLYC